MPNSDESLIIGEIEIVFICAGKDPLKRIKTTTTKK